MQAKLDFQLITNQPIYEPLQQAIDAIARGLPQSGDIAKQATQFKAACALDGKPLAEFARKCKVIGRSGGLPATKDALAGMIVDWSATSDPVAAAHLGRLKQLVRDKAGYAGQDRNLITRTDILAVFQISDPSDLLPCETALVDVGKIVKREQLDETVALIPTLTTPLLIHASGGIGKTVFMDSLCQSLADSHEVVFFDCFGGGSYRSPEDARHLPKKGLLHIANSLAFRSLCDPIIPGNPDADTLLKVFRRRLEQCVKTLTTIVPDRELALFIDAIDNADIIAQQQSESSFPVLLLNSIHQNPIPGVKLIVSCRTERRPPTFAQCHDLELLPFTLQESTTYLRARLKNLSKAEINVAQSRSNGNPRILEYLLKGGRGLLDDSEIDKTIELDDLINDRINDALSEAIVRGYEQKDIDAFLAGLAVLPPPIPVDEYAGAHGIEPSAVESFASDLSPLLERSNQGLMFRDEPTETFVRKNYSSSPELLRQVADNLIDRQDASVYAARALPGLLHTLDDGERLFKLAFDDRVPPQITSTVGKRNIRYARLKAAALHAALKADYNRLVELLLELSTIAAVDQRGADYILDYPDLVIAAEDVDATRRLFETKTSWPGTRHARLAIANCLSGDDQEAYRHAIAADEWIYHYRGTASEDRSDRARPDHLDIASIPFFLMCEGSAVNGARYLRGWKEWYSFEIGQDVFNLFDFSASKRSLPARRRGDFINGLADIGSISAALSFNELRRPKRKELCIKLARRCKKQTKLELRESFGRKRTYQLEDGLQKCSALALSLGLNAEALSISLRAPHQRPGVWSFRDSFSNHDNFGFMFRVALVSAAKNTTLHEKDLLPRELVPICASIKKDISGKDFRDKVKERIPNYVKDERNEDDPKNDAITLTWDDKQSVERFLDVRLEPLLVLTKALAAFLAAPARGVNKAFLELLKAWEFARKGRDNYQVDRFDNVFRMLGLETALFALWARSELTPASVKRFLKCMHGQGAETSTLIRIVAILSRRGPLQIFAGEQAVIARALIEDVNDVTYKTSLFAKLGRAILPASIDEASSYFSDGLEQMDAIGSGDYEFTNELLLFATTLKGDELEERDFHTLTNICELNLGDEPEKFYWTAFSNAMSRAAGLRGLAKLSRWDDRSRVELKYTLLPYLTALLKDRRIEPNVALSLNRLANPVEFFECGTKEFAQAIHDNVSSDRADIISEVIQQFEDDNPDTPMDSTLELLASLADEALGAGKTTTYLRAAHRRYEEVRNRRNDSMNTRSEPDARLRKRNDDIESKTQAALDQIASDTDPIDETSLANGIKELNELRHVYGERRDEFFTALRNKVPYRKRPQYIKHICTLENLDIYPKLAELKKCNDEWGQSSAALKAILKDEAIPLVQRHVDDLISDGSLSGYKLKEVSELSDVPIPDLVIELIK